MASSSSSDVPDGYPPDYTLHDVLPVQAPPDDRTYWYYFFLPLQYDHEDHDSWGFEFLADRHKFVPGTWDQYETTWSVLLPNYPCGFAVRMNRSEYLAFVKELRSDV